MRSVRLGPSTIERLFELRRRGAGLRRKEVEVGRFTLPYLEGGNLEGPTVVMIHGFSDTKDSFVDASRSLASTHRLVMPDLPGFSEASSPSDFTYDLPSIAELVAGFFDALGIRRAHVVGSSLGGAVTVQLSMTRPDLVHSMVLVSAAGLRMPTPSPLQLRLDAGDNPFVVDTADDYEAFMRFTMEKLPPIPAPIRRHLAETFVRRAALNSKIMDDLLAGDWDFTPRLSSLDTETLLLWGDRDRLIDLSAGRVYHRELKRSKLVIFHGIGHIPQYECPDRTGRYIRRFLESAEAG
jgi:pimeloyl-ACP methyl ester carboxylesterase